MGASATTKLAVVVIFLSQSACFMIRVRQPEWEEGSKTKPINIEDLEEMAVTKENLTAKLVEGIENTYFSFELNHAHQIQEVLLIFYCRNYFF